MRTLFKYGMPELRDVPATMPASESVFYGKTGELAITEIDLLRFLHRQQDLLLAFAMAGYNIPAVEIVATDYPDLGAQNQNLSTTTLRIDLDGDEPVFEVNFRPHNTGEVVNPNEVGAVLRVYVEPLTLNGAPSAIAFDEATIMDYVAGITPRVDRPTADFLQEHWPNKRGNPHFQERRSRLMHGVEENLRQLIAAQSGGALTFSTWLTPRAPYADMAREELKSNLFGSFDVCVAAPVTAFLKTMTASAAEQWFAAARAGNGSSDQPPGGLRFLDPDNWQPGAQLAGAATPAGRLSPLKATEHIEKTARQIYAAFSDPRVGAESADDGADPPTFRHWNPEDLEFGLDLARIEAPNGTNGAGAGYAPSLAKVLTHRLLQALPSGEVTVSDELPESHDNNQVCDVRTVLDFLKQIDPSLSLPVHRLKARRFRTRARTALRRSGMAEQDADLLTQRLESDAYLLALFRMVQIGIFSIAHMTGGAPATDDELAEEYEYDVEAHWADGHIYLTLPDYDYPGIRLQLLSDDLGYGLTEAVSWEYVPAAEPLQDTPLEETRRKLDPTGGQEKLVIVAAPGVAIEEIEWARKVKIEIIRVQDQALVPAIGERIDPLLLTAPYAIAIDDIIDGVDVDAVPGLEALVDRVNADPRPPVIGVKHLREGAKQGVELSYSGVGEGRWPGMIGTAKVKVLADERSGSHAFAFDVYPLLVTENRVVDYEHYTTAKGEPKIREIRDDVDVLRYRLIVYSTGGVEITIEDAGYNQWPIPDYPTLDYAFFEAARKTQSGRAWSPENLLEIPPQGVPLGTELTGGKVFAEWTEPADSGDFVDRAGVHGLEPNDRPIQAYEAAILFDWMTLLADIGIGMIPVVGDLVDVEELLLSCLTGTDKWGRPVTNMDRALMVAGILLPVVSSSALRAMKSTAKAADPAIGDDWLRAVGED